jgi:hypothetical protein
MNKMKFSKISNIHSRRMDKRGLSTFERIGVIVLVVLVVLAVVQFSSGGIGSIKNIFGNFIPNKINVHSGSKDGVNTINGPAIIMYNLIDDNVYYRKDLKWEKISGDVNLGDFTVNGDDIYSSFTDYWYKRQNYQKNIGGKNYRFLALKEAYPLKQNLVLKGFHAYLGEEDYFVLADQSQHYTKGTYSFFKKFEVTLLDYLPDKKIFTVRTMETKKASEFPIDYSYNSVLTALQRELPKISLDDLQSSYKIESISLLKGLCKDYVPDINYPDKFMCYQISYLQKPQPLFLVLRKVVLGITPKETIDPQGYHSLRFYLSRTSSKIIEGKGNSAVFDEIKKWRDSKLKEPIQINGNLYCVNYIKELNILAVKLKEFKDSEKECNNE